MSELFTLWSGEYRRWDFLYSPLQNVNRSWPHMVSDKGLEWRLFCVVKWKHFNKKMQVADFGYQTATHWKDSPDWIPFYLYSNYSMISHLPNIDKLTLLHIQKGSEWSSNDLVLPSMWHANRVVDSSQRELKNFIGQDWTGISETKQRVICKNSFYSHRSGV